MRWLVVEEGEEVAISLIATTLDDKARLYALCNHVNNIELIHELWEIKEYALGGKASPYYTALPEDARNKFY